MPDLIKFVAKQWAVGASLVTLVATLILVTDAFGLGSLVWADANPIFAAAIFVLVGVVLLAPLVVGTAIFLADSSSETHD